MTRIVRRFPGSTTVLVLALAALCAWGCARLKPVPTAPKPADSAPPPAAFALPTPEETRRSLHAIRLANVDFEDVPVGQALRKLAQDANAAAPAGAPPIGFLFCDLPKKPATPPETAETVPAAPKPGDSDGPVWSRPITISMTDMPVDDAIRFLCMSCDLISRLECGIIAIEDKRFPHVRDMITRGFKVSSQTLRNGQSETKDNDLTPNQLRQTFGGCGVPFPAGSKISYDEQFQLLLVTLPPEGIQRTAGLFMLMDGDFSEMAMIETKIVRVPEEKLAKLGIDPVTGIADWGKLAISPDVETLAGGAVNTMSGNEGVLEAGIIGYLPVRYDPTPITSHIEPTEAAPGTDHKPLPVVGNSTMPAFGDEPCHAGYQLHVTPTVRDAYIINLKIRAEYAGFDGAVMPPGAQAEKMPQRFASRLDTQFELRDGATFCMSRQRVPGTHGGSVWLFTLATATLVNQSGEPVRHARPEPEPPYPQPLASLDSPLIKNASARLSAKLAKVVACDMEPTADYYTFLQKLFQENGIQLVPPPGGAPVLPFTVGACGRFRLESLLRYYMTRTGLPACEKDGKLVLGRSPGDAATRESRRVAMSHAFLCRLLSHFSDGNFTNTFPAGIHDAFVAGMQVDPATTFVYDATEGELVITGREAGVIAEQLQPLMEYGYPSTERIEVVFESAEIPRKELLKLAHANGFTDADALGNAGVLPPRLAMLVRSSPKTSRVLALSNMVMSGSESALEEVQERSFPFRWEAPTAASPKPGEPLAATPVYGEPTHLGSMLHVTPTVRDRRTINLVFKLEKTAFDGWDEFAGTAQLENRPATPLATPTPRLARLGCDSQIDVYDGATVQVARIQGKKRADSASQAFFGRDNVLAPDAKLGEERDLFIFVTASLLREDGTPLKKK